MGFEILGQTGRTEYIAVECWTPPEESPTIKLKTTHKFVESQAAKAVVGQTIY